MLSTLIATLALLSAPFQSAPFQSAPLQSAAGRQGPNADPQPKQVRCDVQVILSTAGAPDIAPELRPIKRYLENSFGNRYSRFEHVSASRLLLGKDQRGGVSLPNGNQLSLTWLGAEDGLLRLAMEVGSLKTQVKVHDGGLFFQAGRKHKDGMLVVAIRVTAVGSAGP